MLVRIKDAILLTLLDAKSVKAYCQIISKVVDAVNAIVISSVCNPMTGKWNSRIEPYRREVMIRRAQGHTLAQIAAWLDTQGVKVTRQAVHAYLVVRAAGKKMKSRATLEPDWQEPPSIQQPVPQPSRVQPPAQSKKTISQPSKDPWATLDETEAQKFTKTKPLFEN